MALYNAWTELCSSLDIASNEMLNYCAGKPAGFTPTTFSVAEEFYLEGLLSYAWQAWCQFCRQCLFESCTGTTNGSGLPVVPHPLAASDLHVSSAAIRAKKGTPPYWANTNSILRYEPTWGDVNILATIIPRLAPNNATQLAAAFSSAYSSAKALQVIRNATAHRNSQTLNEVRNLASAYFAFGINSPLEALFWISPNSRDFLATHAFDDLRDVALSCIS